MGQHLQSHEAGHLAQETDLKLVKPPRLMPVLQAAVLFNEPKTARKRLVHWE